jgi:hypothetical protein
MDKVRKPNISVSIILFTPDTVKYGCKDKVVPVLK